MSVLFLCGCLEPGRDGVGDYCRRLAARLLRNGHQAWVVALNDHYITTPAEEEQLDEAVFVPVLRLDSHTAISDKINVAQQWIQRIEPDWISLQYVPYAFHKLGLPFRWMRQFKKLSSSARWHIMLHELWVGSVKENSFKDKLIGIFQQYIINKTINNLSITITTTSTAHYKKLLQDLGHEASVLPIFSNMPYGNVSNVKLYNQLPAEVRNNRNDWYIATLFGSIHPFVGIETNVIALQQKAQADNKQLLLTHVGRSHIVTSFLEDLKKDVACEYFTFGEQAAEDIASFFHHIDFGLSTYSTEALTKSGSIAAMLYNRLPVVLLKNSAVSASSVQYTYAKFVLDIPTLQLYCSQVKDWSIAYGLNAAASFYINLPK